MTKNDEVPKVIFSGRSTRCDECDATINKGDMLRLKGGGERCLPCVGLDGMVFLEAGDATLTRRARRHSNNRQAIVCVRRRGRMNRRGILVEPDALQAARTQCEADADRRARKRAEAAERRQRREARYRRDFATAIRELYPGCPEDREHTIARHACEKHSRRVGRSAAGKELKPAAIHAAVRAHVRHRETNYHTLLQRMSRSRARRRVAPAVREVLATWRRS